MKTVVVFVAIAVAITAGSVMAQDPVSFPDAELKAAVETELWIADPTPTDMLGLNTLRAVQKGISDLTGLEYAGNLQSLNLAVNEINDVSPLAGLNNLQELVLNNNQISDISALAGLPHLVELDVHDNFLTELSALAAMTELRRLVLHNNQISDISGLAGLENLRFIDLLDNQISDISALADLTALTHLDLRNNLLNDDAYDVYLPQILANNPDAEIKHDPRTPRALSITSTEGGSATAPGEGTFVYEDGDIVRIEAQAEPGYMFLNWSGSFSTTDNPLTITMDQDHQITANFVPLPDVLYVDDDAATDPGPNDPTVSDAYENGTVEHPFDRIQEAIDLAADGISIFVRPGFYGENINFLGKSIELLGIDANDFSNDPYPIIDGADADPVVTFAGGEDPNCLLMGFVLTRGLGQTAGAIECTQSNPTVANCLIVGNRAFGSNAAAVHCTDSNAVFVNCTIADNYSGHTGVALRLVNSTVAVTNSILWGNVADSVLTDTQSRLSIRYSDVAGGWPGTGNLDTDPLLARRGYWADAKDPKNVAAPDDVDAVWMDGDYHLVSEIGRWDLSLEGWVQDDTFSPCIDGGDPAEEIGNELAPHGDLVNMGAYGRTSQASKSLGQGIQWNRPIRFLDENLKAAVEAQLWTWDPTPTDMLALTDLEAIQQTIANLSGLEYATNLQKLEIPVNRITDVSPLAGLGNLEMLVLNNNQIDSIAVLRALTHLRHLDIHDNFLTELSALSKMKNLETLILHNNQVHDISALAGLTNLQSIDLLDNEISDISALAELRSLTYLDLRNNRLNDEAFDIYLPQIQANNPEAYIRHDPRVPRSISITATDGGSVIDPGEGRFTYEHGEVVRLEARAQAGYEFVSWSGTFATAENPTSITLTQDHYIKANFVETDSGK